ncbi:lipoate--protein ligase family protein [Pseudomonas abieticivorans]|uniref:lipoate--protein ligase family protein n=1 Tax=Pseudomonas abieticivorans TaxID=2931382 RepID=UPI0020BDA1CC|nr:lipoate--protein ligase family protein [Pseudomonas sp. PIA16]
MQRLTVEAGLKAEQDLLAAVCSGEQRDGLLFWQPTDRALVMPRRMSRLPGFEPACHAVQASGWPVLLRETGGEPVPQSAATLNVALVYVAPRSEGDQNRIELAYQRLCQPLSEAVTAAGGQASLGEIDGAFCDGRFNVNINGRKWVGTAQRWRQGLSGTRPVVLVHGAMLMDNERESMVAAVNAFNVACQLPQRVRAHSHIAFAELATTAGLVQALGLRYRQLLATLREIP